MTKKPNYIYETQNKTLKNQIIYNRVINVDTAANLSTAKLHDIVGNFTILLDRQLGKYYGEKYSIGIQGPMDVL